jgi:hypothetical protein
MGKLTISMAIFNSYVKLPEGSGSDDDDDDDDERLRIRIVRICENHHVDDGIGNQVILDFQPLRISHIPAEFPCRLALKGPWRPKTSRLDRG